MTDRPHGRRGERMTAEQLVQSLAQILWADDSGRDDVPLNTTGPGTQRVYARVARKLLPVMEQFARQRSAEELRRAADECHLNISGRDQLRDRANALEAEQ